MIEGLRNISSETPSAEVWKYLRSFLHVESAQERILELHKVDLKHKDNVKKQAQQIGYCIRQAEEYFKASSQVGLPTKPLLLYYGAASLSQALVLLKKDGNYSLDAQRQNKKHRHHGLEPSGFEAATRSTSIESFFSALQSKCYTKKETTKAGVSTIKPWGQFPLFYDSLAPPVFLFKFKIKNNRDRVEVTREHSYLSANKLPIESFLNKNFNALELLKTLPDMYYHLKEMNINPDLCLLNLSREMQYIYKPVPINSVDSSTPSPALVTAEYEKVVDTHMFAINNISDEHLLLITFLTNKGRKSWSFIQSKTQRLVYLQIGQIL